MTRMVPALATLATLATFLGATAARAQPDLPTGWFEGTPWWIGLTQATAMLLIVALTALTLRRKL
ncbi:hypothetical protein [Oleomonas cavernae]|nr:hypothetical protein [Oleomonas cavernae]